MSDIKLFKLNGDSVTELEGRSVSVEKSLQELIERNLEVFLGVRFLASEYSTGQVHRGRIDTLGIDENGCPVIIEYKRSTNENVINQGLFYLDWLLDHKGEFELLVTKQLDQKAAKNIEWSTPRLLCIAGGFTRYDEHAVQQISRNIELIRYNRFGGDLLLFELVNALGADAVPEVGSVKKKGKTQNTYKTVTEYLGQADKNLQNCFESLKAMLLLFGDDVQVKTLKYYFAFRRIKNFACVEIHMSKLVVCVKVDPGTINLEKGFTRDVSKIGHFGTGDLEITISSVDDIIRAQPLLLRSCISS